MKLRKATIPLDQIILAIPAAAFIATPLVDLFMDFFQRITNNIPLEDALYLPFRAAFTIIPYLPPVLAAILALALIVRLIVGKDKHLLKIFLKRTRTFQTTLLLFVMYLGLVLMSIGVNGFTSYAVNGHPYTKMSMWTYIANVLLFLGCSSLIYDQRVKEFLAKACCVIAVLYALYAMIQYNLTPSDGDTLKGTFHNSNHYGYYLAVSIGLTAALVVEALGKKKNTLNAVVWCVMLFIQCFALGYNNTLGVWIAVLFVHIFLFVVYRVRDGRFNLRVLVPLAIFLSASVISAIFTMNIFSSILKTVSDVGNIVQGLEKADEAGSGRWLIWRLTVKHIIERPIFGNGIEGLLEIITLEGSQYGSPHNEYLEYTAFFGVPAGIAYIVACVSVFTHGLKNKKQLNAMTLVCMAGSFSYLVSAFFGVCFYYTVTYPFIFLGLALNFADKDRPKAVEKADEETPK